MTTLFEGFSTLPSYVQDSYRAGTISDSNWGGKFLTLTDKWKNPINSKIMDSDYFNWVMSPDYMTYMHRLRSGNSVKNTSDPASLDALLKYFKNMDAWDAMKLQWKMNPMGTTMGLVGGGAGLAGSIWSAFQNYKTSKQMMDLEQDKYNLQKQAYEANEARNQEKFNWLRQARATSQL